MSKPAMSAKVKDGRIVVGGLAQTQMSLSGGAWRTVEVVRILRNGAETRAFFADGTSDVTYAMRVA